MKKLFTFALALLLVLSLVACTQQTPAPTDDPGAGDVSGEPEATAAPGDEEQGDEEAAGVTPGGTLVISVIADAATMNPLEIRNPSNLNHANPIFETLLAYDENGDPQPFLAKSITEDVENLTYTIELNEGILFHDGTELTAEVCKWNLDLYMAEGVLRSSFFSNVDSVEVTGDYTVVIHLKQWDSTLPNALARQGGYMASKEAYEKDPEGFGEHPVGTGPFMFDEWEHGVSISFVKFADYWQGEPYLDGVRFDVYANDLVAQAAVQAGDVHIMSPSDVTIIDDMRSKGYTVYNMNVPQSCYTLCFNCVSDDPLSDVLVRQAIAYAIDADAITAALFGDYGAATNQYALVGSTYYNDEVNIGFDLEKAKELLAQAGYADGFSTKLTVVNSTRIVEVCQVIADMLSEIGIEVELNLVDAGAYTNAIGGWEPGMFLHTMSMYNGVDAQLAGNFKQGLQSGLGINCFLHPDDLNELLLSASASGKAEAVEQFKDAQKLIVEDYCLVRCFTVSFQSFITSPNLHDCGYAENTPYNSTLHKAWIEQ